MLTYKKGNYVKDKVIVITGGSAGFGEAIGRKAAAMGAKIVLAARREEKLKTITEEIRAAGGEASYLKTDVRCRTQVNALAQYAIDTYGHIDVMINNAGTMPQAFFSDADRAMEAWEDCIDTCIKGTLYGISAVYKHMIEREQGHIINFSSIMGNFPSLGSGVYNACKVAVRYISESLRIETRGKIKVTTIRPSYVPTTELTGTVVNMNGMVASTYNRLYETLTADPLDPGKADRNCIRYAAPTAEDMADNVIFVINQPLGIDMSDITVRASGEIMFN